MSAPPLVLHIDRLVLHGVRPSDRQAVAEALREELATQLAALLADPAAAARWQAGNEVARLRARSLGAGTAGAPRQLGIDAARGIVKEIASWT